MKRTVKIFPSSRFACQSIPPAGAIKAVWGRVCDSFGQGGPRFWARFDFEAQTLPDMSEEMAHFHDPTVTCLTNNNAPHYCEAYWAENETRTMSCNMLIINYLCESEKASGET